MSASNSFLWRYPDPIAVYKGKGVLEDQSKEHQYECAFEVAQLSSGDIFLRCNFNGFVLMKPDTDKIFTGNTVDGFQLDAVVGNRHLFKGNLMEFRLTKLRVQISSGKIHSARFGVTNFEFLGLSGMVGIPLDLNITTEEAILVSIEPMDTYKKRMENISRTRGIDVTCEILVQSFVTQDVEAFEPPIRALCEVMSVARGTRVNWIYRDMYDESGKLLSRAHHQNITCPYQVMPLIDKKNGAETKSFIETAYKLYSADLNKQKHYRRIINAFLDGRVDSRFIEARSISIALLMEVIKDVAPAVLDIPKRNLTVDAGIFNKLRKAIESLIDKEIPESNAKQNIKEKLGELNRRSFRRLITEICNTLGLKIEDSEIQLFVKCRNSLVHRGQFYGENATEDDRQKYPALNSVTEEYFFVTNFMDRLILRIFGYDGTYYNWSTPGSPFLNKLKLIPKPQ